MIVLLLIAFGSYAYSQDSTQFKQIDSLVKLINNSGIKEQRDTILHNYPDVGLSMKIYLAMLLDGKQLKKYVNYVITEKKENDGVILTTSENIFYYDRDQLIRVDEFAEGKGKRITWTWYFYNDKCLNDQEGKDGRSSRGTQLLGISRAMQAKINN